MPDYKQGIIYTVRCKTDDTLIYVGCTTELTSPDFFLKKFCYEVIVKQKIYKWPTNHYSHRRPCGLTDVVIDWEGERGGRI